MNAVDQPYEKVIWVSKLYRFAMNTQKWLGRRTRIRGGVVYNEDEFEVIFVLYTYFTRFKKKNWYEVCVVIRFIADKMLSRLN